MDVRRLGPADRDLLRTVRLAALADAPSAFGSTLAREASFTDAEWDARLANPAGVTLIVEQPDGCAAGVVTGLGDDDVRVAHLIGLWVAPDGRGRGTADALVEAVLAWAAGRGARQVRLQVAEGNVRAERLYQRHGFVRTGGHVRRDHDGRCEIDMERPLGPEPLPRS